MTSESGHGSRKRLRSALLEAATTRGANLGSTAAVAQTLYEHHLISADVDLNDMREAARSERRKWKNMYTYTLKLPLEGDREFAWCVSDPILTLQFLLDHAPCFKDLLNLQMACRWTYVAIMVKLYQEMYSIQILNDVQ